MRIRVLTLGSANWRMLSSLLPVAFTIAFASHLSCLPRKSWMIAPDNFPSSQVDRGGGLTWHGPGQLVGYPIFLWKEESVREVITTIEEWIIMSLSEFGIDGLRDNSMQGVWFEGHKIASIGLAFSKWVSRHGFDVNLNTPEGRIESVEGCGLPLGKHAALAKFGYNISIPEMQNALLSKMPEILGRKVSRIINLENL